MSEKTRDRLIEALEEKIDYFRKEYQLDAGDCISALEIIKLSIFMEAHEDNG